MEVIRLLSANRGFGVLYISKLAAEAFDGLGYLRAALFICIYIYGPEWALSIDSVAADTAMRLSKNHRALL
jgi:hypothetical protein